MTKTANTDKPTLFADAIDSLGINEETISDAGGSSLRVRRLVHKVYDDSPTPAIVASDHVLVFGMRGNSGIERYEEGRLTGTVNNDRRASLVPAGQITQWRLPVATEVLHFYLAHDTFRDLVTREGYDPDKIELMDRMDVIDPFLASLVPTLMLEMAAGEPASRLVVDGFDSVIAGHLLRSYSNKGWRLDASPARRRTPRDPKTVGKAQAAMTDRMDEVVPLKDIAEDLGLSPFALLRRFKVETGMTPHQWLRRERLIRAQALLSETDTPVAEIAYATGFSSQAHLTTLMRREHGVTPGAYRKRRRG
ncbi:MAG: AraC family transcriptional regulator [Pseudomonadota bacterium]